MDFLDPVCEDRPSAGFVPQFLPGKAPAVSIECSIVVPLFNEEANLPILHQRLMDTLGRLAISFEIIYVNDGSTDRTRESICGLRDADNRVKLISLSRNFGHQAALCAGLEAAGGRATISIDGDLQDPPELIAQLLEKWREGAHIVYARRRTRQENPLKQAACFAFYRVLRRLAEIPIPLDTGDYALMDRRALDQLNAMPERTRFIRGLRSWVGFKQADVLYDRDPRYAGESKYSFSRLARLGLDGVFGFSDAPLKGITYMGLAICAAGLGGFVLQLAGVWQAGHLGPVVAMLAGVQLIALGIMGEYIARIHQEVRARPLFVAAERLGFKTPAPTLPNILEFLPPTEDPEREHDSLVKLGTEVLESTLFTRS